MEVNYKNKKRYKTAKYPIRQPLFFTWLIWLLCKFALIGKKYRLEKINMEGLKPPYILLSNHQYFIDFMIGAMGTFPHRVNNVVSIDGYYRRPWLMELIGCIGTRKYVTDLHLVKSIRKVLQRGDILSMYPEARYSPCGTTSFLPESIGKLIKMNKVPVVVVIHRGNYLYSPFWNFRKKRKSRHYCTMTKVLTPEQIEVMSADEINRVIKGAMQYDEYAYQKEAGIRITEPYRAEGLHKILYQCPHCKTEFKISSKGSVLTCESCGKQWNLEEDGSLKALNGETEFAHVPDWYNWQRQQVQRQIEEGTYSYEDEVEAYGFPRCWRYIPLGKAKVTHDPVNGFTVEGHYRGKDYRMHRTPEQMNSLHVEYDYNYFRGEDCFDISSEKDSIYCFPTKKNVLTKLAIATELCYLKAQVNKKAKV